MLLVTHNRDEAYHMCDAISVMDEGRLHQPRPTKQLFADPGTTHAARLTGCKNIAPAQKAGEHSLYVPGWGITLETALPVPEQVTHVGIRAHYFGPKIGQNRFPVRFAADMEEPFEWVIEFRYQHQAAGTDNLWWRLPKEKRLPDMPAELGIAPINVLPLCAEEQDE